MVEVTGESSGQSEDVVILVPRVSQRLNLSVQLNINRLISLAQPLHQPIRD